MGLRHPEHPQRGGAVPPREHPDHAGKDLLRNFLGLGPGERVRVKGHDREARPGRRLTEEDAAAARGMVRGGEATPAQIGALLAALAARGEAEDEVVGSPAPCARGRCPSSRAGAVDTCGTGGDGAGTFNISTAAAFVVAACGVPVAKHGNRSASGRCGSADVLEALGVRIDAPAPRRPQAARRVGLDVPLRAAVPRLDPPRGGTAGRSSESAPSSTCSVPSPIPRAPAAQVVGVARPELTEFVARCLRRIGDDARVGRPRGRDSTS